MIDRETYYRIRCLYHDAHFNKKEIARTIGLSVETVRNWLKEPEFRPPKPRGERICEPFKDTIADRLNRGFCATDVYRDLAENHGFRGSCTCLRQYVREQGLRPRRDAEFVSLWILMVKLAPLPSCAQFLNVIESVFSGMARAVIHNSNYESVEECKAAIDRHFAERNEYFKRNPKRAGNKIWGDERDDRE